MSLNIYAGCGYRYMRARGWRELGTGSSCGFSIKWVEGFACFWNVFCLKREGKKYDIFFFFFSRNCKF